MFEEYPIFLLDDIDAELDPGRIKRVLEHLDGRTQTFISTSKRDIGGWSSGPVSYRMIEHGKATVVSSEDSAGVSFGMTDSIGNLSSFVAQQRLEEAAPVELPIVDMPGEDAAMEDYEDEVDPHEAPF